MPHLGFFFSKSIHPLQVPAHLKIQDFGPPTWPGPMARCSLFSTPAPFFAEPPISGKGSAAGGPLLKLRLTSCSNGDILSITVSHLVAGACVMGGGGGITSLPLLWSMQGQEGRDASQKHWTPLSPPQTDQRTPPLHTPSHPDGRHELHLLRRLSELYRGTLGTPLAGTTQACSYDALRPALPPPPPGWKPTGLDPRLTPAQWASLPCAFWRFVAAEQGVHTIHLPREAVERIREVAGGAPIPGPPVSSLDAVQAFLAVLVNSLGGKPLVARAPALLTVNVELLHARLGLAPRVAHQLERAMGNTIQILQVPGLTPGGWRGGWMQGEGNVRCIPPRGSSWDSGCGRRTHTATYHRLSALSASPQRTPGAAWLCRRGPARPRLWRRPSRSMPASSAVGSSRFEQTWWVGLDACMNNRP